MIRVVIYGDSPEPYEEFTYDSNEESFDGGDWVSNACQRHTLHDLLSVEIPNAIAELMGVS